MRDSRGEDAKRGLDLARKIKPLLAGHGPSAQGAALLDLLSIYLAGHHPALREGALAALLAALPAMIAASEREQFGPEGFPQGEEEQ